MAVPGHTVRRSCSATLERLFDEVVAEDVLPKVLKRFGPVPGAVGTRDLTGPWTQPGSGRTVMLSDGSTARETLTAFERPHRFEYRVEQFSGPLRLLVSHAIGRWTFSAAGSGSAFEWTYEFHPRRAAFAAPLRIFVGTAWAGYMARCADRSVGLAEAA